MKGKNEGKQEQTKEERTKDEEGKEGFTDQTNGGGEEVSITTEQRRKECDKIRENKNAKKRIKIKKSNK